MMEKTVVLEKKQLAELQIKLVFSLHAKLTKGLCSDFTGVNRNRTCICSFSGVKLVTLNQVLLNPYRMPTALTKAKAFGSVNSNLMNRGKTGMIFSLVHCSFLTVALWV